MKQDLREKYFALCGRSRALAWLIGLNLLISLGALLIMAIMSASGADSEIVRTALVLPSDFYTFAMRPWTLATYMFTQFSILHLLVNILWLFWFGRLLLTEYSGQRLAVCYAISGVAGGLGYLVARAAGASSGAYLCGSSAAVLGVMCAAGVLMANRTLRFVVIGDVKVKWIAGICVVLTLIGTEGLAAVSVAHLSGAGCGLIYAIFIKVAGSKNIWSRYNNKDKATTRTPVKNKERRGAEVADAVRGRLNDHERLDNLLDKIRISGYNSLSDTERRELDALTKRL